MAKNREQRRAKQQEVLEEKSAKQNVDPGNPNWEFLCMIREYQESLDFNPLQDGDDFIEHQITVCVRKRPLSKKEDKRKEVDVITCPNRNQVIFETYVHKVHFMHTHYDLSFDGFHKFSPVSFLYKIWSVLKERQNLKICIISVF